MPAFAHSGHQGAKSRSYETRVRALLEARVITSPALYLEPAHNESGLYLKPAQ